MFEERAPSPCFDEGDLSKDFGLDITVSDGGLVTSASNQRQYQAECSRIYQQFVLNMADYINEESQLRKTLNVLQSQKRSSPRKDGGTKRREIAKTPEMIDEDAFTAAQLEEFKNILNRESSRSRLSHASGFAVGEGQIDAAATSQTPKLGQTQSGRTGSSVVNQPAVSHMFPALKERPPSVKASQLRRDSKSAASSVDEEKKRAASVSNSMNVEIEYDGIMEPNADLSNNRRIRMNQKAFTKLMTGQVRVKLLNKSGDFVLTPLSSGAPVLTPEETEKQLLDNREKVAVVKQKTTFQSPTLASDLKISNLVAIQKALKGQSAKRITVGEVMKSARDRKARLFRIQMSGNRFDEFDRQEEDIGYVHEVKAAFDLGDEEDAGRAHSRLRFSPHINLLRQAEQRPESRLRSPTPIPLHILDPKAASSHLNHPSRANTPGILKQVSTDTSGLTVHKDCSDFELRYSQAVDQCARPTKEKSPQKQLSVIHLDFDEADALPKGSRTAGGHHHHSSARPRSEPGFAGYKDDHNQPSAGGFPASRSNRATHSKSALPGRSSRMKKRVGIHTDGTRPATAYRSDSPNLPAPPVKKISNMRDTACIVKRWQEEDRMREEKLNRWRMRMSFAATRRGNLAKVLTRAKSGR